VKLYRWFGELARPKIDRTKNRLCDVYTKDQLEKLGEKEADIVLDADQLQNFLKEEGATCDQKAPTAGPDDQVLNDLSRMVMSERPN